MCLQVLSLFDLVRYCVSVCNQIASHLHIFVFKIKPVSIQWNSAANCVCTCVAKPDEEPDDIIYKMLLDIVTLIL